MARQTPVLVKTFGADGPVVLNTVVVASAANVGNVRVPAAPGATNIVGVSQQNFDAANYGPVVVAGIAQCRIVGGIAVNIGDPIKVGDAFGRVTRAVPTATGGANVRGLVGVAMQAMPAAAPADTLIDVLLAPGIVVE